MSLLLLLLALAGPSSFGAVSARTAGDEKDLEATVCATIGGAATPGDPSSRIATYDGPADKNGSGVLTLLNCTGAPLVKAVDRSRWARDRAPNIFNPARTETIPGMLGRYHYLNFNLPELGHVVGLDHWSYAPTRADHRWEGACVHPVEFTMRTGSEDTVFRSDVDICKTDILILGWSSAKR